MAKAKQAKTTEKAPPADASAEEVVQPTSPKGGDARRFIDLPTGTRRHLPPE